METLRKKARQQGHAAGASGEPACAWEEEGMMEAIIGFSEENFKPEDCPTKFRAEKWTDVYGPGREHYEQWAVIMLDGDEAGAPCAFGKQESMIAYAERLNLCKGILCGGVQEREE